MIWKIAVALVAAGYVAICAFMYLEQEALLFHPTGPPGDPAAIGLRGFSSVSFKASDGVTLTGWLHEDPTHAKAIILFYGNADSLRPYGRFFQTFADAGYSVLGVNYRGYGGSSGAASETGFYKDADAALDLMKRYASTEKTTLVGRSIGSGVAVDLASRNRVQALVLISPYTSIQDVAAEMYPFLPVRLLSRYAFASIDKIAKVGVPLLVVHGDRDTSIPLRQGQSLYEAAAEPKRLRILEGQGHNDLDLGRIASEIIDFAGGR